MKSTRIISIVAIPLLLTGSGLAQDPGQQQQEEQQQAAPPAPERVIGEAQTQEEFDAYSAISTAPDKVAAANQFFATYPDSGLSAFVHQVLAQHYDDAGEMVQFLDHASKVLEELPDNAPMLVRLAFVNAERNQTSQTIIDRAERALEVMETLEKPAEAPA